MTDVKPVRIQRKRTKGWKMPENTVYVGRPTMWGNPFHNPNDTPQDHVYFFRWCLEVFPAPQERIDFWRREGGNVAVLIALAGDTGAITSLRGKNLACWCPLCDAHKDGKPFGVECADCSPCHADVLLKLANQEPAP